MGDGVLKRQLSQKLDEYEYDFSQFRLDTFTRWVEDRRGRPIWMLPVTLPADMGGPMPQQNVA